MVNSEDSRHSPTAGQLMTPGEPSVLGPEIRRAIASALAGGNAVIVSYIGLDGYPHLCLAPAAEERGPAQLALWLPSSESSDGSDGSNGPDGSDGSIFEAIKSGPRVALLCRDPLSGALYRWLGRAHAPAEPEEDGAGTVTAEHPSDKHVRELLVSLEQLEVTHPQARKLQEPAQPAKAPARVTTGATTVLDVSGLSIYYGSKRAVHDLSLQVLPGEIFGLLGPNGAGKTSTLSAVEGLLKPRSGKIFLDGTDVLRHPIEARAKMGVQLQATSFQSNLTIKQILRLFAGLYGVRLSDAALAAALASVGLEAEAGRPFKQLSGGQQQRVALQVAVVHKPVLLLLDEPTSGLDPQSRRQLWGRIENLRQDGGSILLTTHSMEEAQAVCDRVAIMDHGEILTCGSPLELIARHRDDPEVQAVAHGEVTLDDVFVGLTGKEIRD